MEAETIILGIIAAVFAYLGSTGAILPAFLRGLGVL